MKIMIQEEKLEEARRLYKDANADQRYVLERLFPQLKESDGERIRKEIIKIFNVENFEGYNVDNAEAIEWLKKQKPAEWSEEDEKKRSLLISILKVNHPNDYFKVNPANTSNMEAMSTKELVDWLNSLKPQSTSEWSDADRENAKDICTLIDYAPWSEDFNKEKLKRWLRTIVSQKTERK